MERTLAIIKPDAIKAKYTGKIIDRIEQEGFSVVAITKIHLTKMQAESFYAVHKDRGFFDALTTFLASGPIIAMALEKNNAIQDWRTLMGATDPIKADQNTLRKLYGASIDHNATHGSDAQETMEIEINFFFPELQ